MQRAKVDSGFSERRSLAFRISRRAAGIVVVAGMAVSGGIDLSTGDAFWMGPVYMGFIGLAAWALGWREALGTLVACVTFTLWANSSDMYPYGAAASPADFVLRLPPILAIIGLLAHARHACETEWHLARTDPLTGAMNRKAFFELAGTIEDSKSWHLLAYADLDGLKQLNDEHGHEHGDLSLKAFATHVRAAIRKDDIFARIGGDEFLVYLAVRDAPSGLAVANRLHRAMNTATTEFSNVLQCSVGALILAPGHRSIDRELRMADELMYEAKQTGSALTVAVAREKDGMLSARGRWMTTGTMAGHPPRENRTDRKVRRGKDAPSKAA